MKNTLFALLNLLTVWLMPFLALGQSAGLESRQPTPGSLGNVSISASIGFIRSLFSDYEFYSNYKHTLYQVMEVDSEMTVPYIWGGLFWEDWKGGESMSLPGKE